MSGDKPRRLGRGLEALISGAPGSTSAPAGDLQRIALARIRANPFQPRREFDAADLAELEASLRASGLLQPIIVRRRGDAYELVAGERRLRAATNIGWSEISAVIRELDDQTMLVLALVENLQRSNLNPIEEARGYRRLINDFKFTQQQVAEAVGKDRTTITNLLRVLSLPEAVQQMVEQGALSMGHARALLALEADATISEFAANAATGGLSVRQLEQKVRDRMASSASDAGGGRAPNAPRDGKATSTSSAARRIEDDLRGYLQTDVRVYADADSKGRVEIGFYSAEDLDRILELILRERRSDF